MSQEGSCSPKMDSIASNTAVQSGGSSNDKRKTKAEINRDKSNKKKVKLRNGTDRNKIIVEETVSAGCLDRQTADRNPKSIVEELKLFQNNNLLNQQDPIQQLQLQLNKIIDTNDKRTQRPEPQEDLTHIANGIEHGLSHMQQSQDADENGRTHLDLNGNTENILTVKKGVLWQQQNFDKFHRRLFNRWKKRYFILTIDYLVCFKRSVSKVGHSEMGKFLYKTSLGDIVKVCWLKPEKSDKGPIVLHTTRNFNLYLWSKENLDEWMFMIHESIQRNKIRKFRPTNQHSNVISNYAQPPILDELYANTAALEGVARIFTEPTDANSSTIIKDNSSPTGKSLSKLSSIKVDHSSARVDAEQEKILASSTICPLEDEEKATKNLTGNSNSSSKSPDQAKNQRSSLSELQGGSKVNGVSKESHEGFVHTSMNDSEAPISKDPSIVDRSAADSPRLTEKSNRFSSKQAPKDQANENDHFTQGQESSSFNSYKVASSGSNSREMSLREKSNENVQSNLVNSNERSVKQQETSIEESLGSRVADQSSQPGDDFQRTQTNLIRRDDSWHSLVSLTRVGKPNAMNVAQRSLYAQHIMPSGCARENQYQKGRMNSIESTVTPLRIPLQRHQSIQSSKQAGIRPFLANGQHATSFDVAPNLPSQANQSVSYHQKLLQLQLLHNSNNVDYIRQNGYESDYQIYGPESTTNPYGYSSMRSNLKSAASEFSFIRPSSSNHIQSTLPPQNPPILLENQVTSQQQPLRTSLIPGGKLSIKQNDMNNNDIRGCSSGPFKQYLINPTTGEMLVNQKSEAGEFNVDPRLVPPMRDLPLKPNKRRQLNDVTHGEDEPKSSSLTSSIACFFRRAFSRRSKRRSKCRSKLGESCSSSLGAYEDGITSVPMVPSAFSTGSKSASGRKNQNNQQINQSTRMIDMIEAFTNKVVTKEDEFNKLDSFHANNQKHLGSGMNFITNVTPQKLTQTNALRHFGSPLHKSNSISASTGLSLADVKYRIASNYNDELMSSLANGASPIMPRSAKVMSANLTPILSQWDSTRDSNNDFALSPRISRPDQLPRPSSIYGQPSLISSPVIVHESRDNFGLHRNSLHSHLFRERSTNPGVEMKRHALMKVPYLDTTKEVAEDLPSPSSESRDHNRALIMERNKISIKSPMNCYPSRRENYNLISESPSSGRLSTRKAIVNPILQSPTMNTIYDNHPTAHESGYSHYDNHNQLHSERYNLANNSPMRLSQSGFINHYSASSMLDSSPMIVHDLYSRDTNSPRFPLSSEKSTTSNYAAANNNLANRRKPSAIVAPSTPQHDLINHYQRNSGYIANQADLTNDLRQQRSPMISRGAMLQSYYERSPLANHDNQAFRHLGDISSNDRTQLEHGEAVVNIAGAPGINLDPLLAASLLRGTNIDAYESSTFDRSSLVEHNQESKTFLVATRLSKSMAYSKSSSNETCSTPPSIQRGQSSSNYGNISSNLRSSKDELSSSGSRSINSSIGVGSLRARASISTNSSLEDHQEESSSSETHSNGKVNETPVAKKRTSRRLSKDKTRDHPEKITNQTEDFGTTEVRNWVTSKLNQ